jgi:hypothetical protein
MSACSSVRIGGQQLRNGQTAHRGDVRHRESQPERWRSGCDTLGVTRQSGQTSAHVVGNSTGKTVLDKGRPPGLHGHDPFFFEPSNEVDQEKRIASEAVSSAQQVLVGLGLQNVRHDLDNGLLV